MSSQLHQHRLDSGAARQRDFAGFAEFSDVPRDITQRWELQELCYMFARPESEAAGGFFASDSNAHGRVIVIPNVPR